MRRAGIIGGGAWGTALAQVCARADLEAVLWAREPEVVARLGASPIDYTRADFVEEDRTRRLPASERVTHTLLTLNYGVILALLVPWLAGWDELDPSIKKSFDVALHLGTLVGALAYFRKDVARNVDAETVSGDIRISGRLGEEIAVQSVSGDVEVRVLDTAVRRLEGSSVSGDMDVRMALAPRSQASTERWTRRSRRSSRRPGRTASVRTASSWSGPSTTPSAPAR